MKRLYVLCLFVTVAVLLTFCNYTNAETAEVFLQTPGASGKPEVKLDGVSPKLKIEKSLMSISVSTLTSNPEREASVFINQKIVAVSSNNCLGAVSNENTVVFRCIPQTVGEIGKILIQADGQEMSLKYSTGLVLEPDIHPLWSIAPLEIPLGQISTIESNGIIWTKTNSCKIKREGVGKIKVINRPGDVNLDGIVNILDLVVISKQFGAPVSPEVPEDMNWNGVIDSEDLMLMAEKFGTKYTVPQPAPPNPNRTIITWSSIKAKFTTR